MEDILNGPARAELERLGAAQGLIDPEALKMADLTTVAIDADGKITGAAAALAKFRTDKPYAFRQRTAKELGSEEYVAVLKRIIADSERPRRPAASQSKSAKDMSPVERAAWMANHKRNYA